MTPKQLQALENIKRIADRKAKRQEETRRRLEAMPPPPKPEPYKQAGSW